MDLYRWAVFIHLFLAVVFTGLVMYWMIMLVSLSRQFSLAETSRLLGIAHQARWPHVAVPWKWRLPLPWVTTLVMVGIWLSGIMVSKLGGMPEGLLWWTKLGLFMVLIGLQAVVTRRPYPLAIRLNFGLALVILVVSGLVAR